MIYISKDGVDFCINRQDCIFISSHKEGLALEFWRFSEDHSAHGWSDLRLVNYLLEKLKKDGKIDSQ